MGGSRLPLTRGVQTTLKGKLHVLEGNVSWMTFQARIT